MLTDVTLTRGAAPEWPNSGLDIDALKAGGWKPRPFEQFIVKIHSRCNLACDYCYMYELADQTWAGRPAVMSRDTSHGPRSMPLRTSERGAGTRQAP